MIKHCALCIGSWLNIQLVFLYVCDGSWVHSHNNNNTVIIITVNLCAVRKGCVAWRGLYSLCKKGLTYGLSGEFLMHIVKTIHVADWQCEITVG